MKRTLSLLFVLLMLTSAFLISCGKEPSVDPPVETKQFYASETYHAAIEMPSRVLLLQMGGPWYYSKVDGESYVFCFDPLCQHTIYDNCLSRHFRSTGSLATSAIYSEKENRVYLARGQKLYSTSFDASDLRLECSLGEKGEIGDSFYGPELQWLRCVDNYIFFIYHNNETGHTQLMRYDTSKRKLEEMTSADEWALGYEIADGYIYLKLLTEDKLKVYMTADFNLENRKIVDDPIYPTSGGVSMGVYDGEYFYERAPEGLFKINPLTGEKSLVSDDPLLLGYAQILAINNGYIYFISDEMKKIGDKYNEILGVTEDILLPNYRLYRISLDGKIELMLELPGSIDTLNFVDGGVIIHIAELYDENGESLLTRNGQMFVYYEIDGSGNFINPKPLARYAGDTEIVKYLSNSTIPTVETTATEETAATEATTAITEPTEPTATTIDVTTLPIVGEYTNLSKDMPFEEFLLYKEQYRIDKEDPYSVEKYVSIANGGMTPMNYIIVTILGYGGFQGDGILSGPTYYVNVERYGEGCIDDTVYKMIGSYPYKPRYGMERFEIGRRYLVYNLNSTYKKDPEKIFSPTVVLHIDEHDGETYVYNCNALIYFTHLSCAIKITDPTENLVYRPGENDDVIAYMEENGITPPTYGYKCKLDDYVQTLSNLKEYNVKDLPVVGEYTSIREQVPFESFAELPLDMRLDPDNPYLIKEKKNILRDATYKSKYDIITVSIAGYIGEEIGEDGMVYSYYYVYVDLDTNSIFGDGPWTTKDNTVHIMKAYGSPAHPYYGQQRYEIGDVLVRYDTDLEELKNDRILSPTSMFLVDSSRKYYRMSFVYPDFNFDLDVSVHYPPETIINYMDVYFAGRDDDIIAYMKENKIEMPKLDAIAMVNWLDMIILLTGRDIWDNS